MFSAYNIILWNIKAQTKKFQVKLLFHKKLKWGITDDVARIFETSACNVL